MREILFRGKSISTSKWVYGWLITGIYGASKPVIVTDSDYDDNNIVNIDYDFIAPALSVNLQVSKIKMV